MQPVAGLIEVMRVARYVEIGQYATDAPDVAGIQPSGVASIVEPPQSRVLDLHPGIFVRYTPCCNPEHPANESISFRIRHVPRHRSGTVEGDGAGNASLARIAHDGGVRGGMGNSILWRMRGRYGRAGRYGIAIATTGINQPRRNTLRRSSEMNIPRTMPFYAMFVVLMGILTGCARTSTLPLAADRIEITVRVAPICSRDDADRLALQKAALETIRSGFENFIVIDTGGGDYISGHTPTTARTTLYGNSATTTVSGGTPLVAHRRILTIQMFHAGESGGETALSARAVLGSDWQTFVTKGAPNTCFGGDG